MSEIRINLDKQLKSESLSKEAEKVEIVYDYLKNTDVAIWSSKWNSLVKTSFKGYPNSERTYRLTEFGEIFLKGLLCKNH